MKVPLIIYVADYDYRTSTVELETKLNVTKVVLKVSMGQKDKVYVNICENDKDVIPQEVVNSKQWYDLFIGNQRKLSTLGGYCNAIFSILKIEGVTFKPNSVDTQSLIVRGDSLALSQSYSPPYSQGSSQDTEPVSQEEDQQLGEVKQQHRLS